MAVKNYLTDQRIFGEWGITLEIDHYEKDKFNLLKWKCCAKHMR
jgi:hypothetical protein